MEYTLNNRLTADTLQYMPNMTDQQKGHAGPILDIAAEMGLMVWYDSERCGLLIGTKKRGPLNLDAPLWVKDGGETENVITMLKMVRALYGLEPGIDLNARLEALLGTLEEMVIAKEKSTSKKKACKKKASSKKSPADKKPVACQTEADASPVKTLRKRGPHPNHAPEHFMQSFREMQEEIVGYGVQFEINENEQCVIYNNPRSKRPAIRYEASPDGHRKVARILYVLRRQARTRADTAA